jgi:cytoskeletal protein RodZ
MSLINDALKKAKRTEPKNLAPADGPALSPVESAHRSGGTDSLMISLVAVILLLAGLLLWQWFRGDGLITVRANTAPAEVKPVPAAIASPAPTPAPVASAPSPAVSPVVNSSNVASTPAVPANASVSTNLEAAAQPPKPAPPTYKLQSIFYFAKNPTAVINGKTVSVGSRVVDARVLAITKDSATIQTQAGQTQVLELP